MTTKITKDTKDMICEISDCRVTEAETGIFGKMQSSINNLNFQPFVV